MKIFCVLTFASWAALAIFFSQNCLANVKKLKYRTTFGECPSQVVGKLALRLIDDFEQTKSLKSIKKHILAENLMDKYFLDTYQINFVPDQNQLLLSFQCPRPLLKTQIYKENGKESYSAILVDNGEFFDPTYEVLLQKENKIKDNLPSLAIPVEVINSDIPHELADIVSKINARFFLRFSEIIINSKREMTVILSVNNHPSSAFLGEDKWGHKVEKLERIINYMEEKKKIPAIINLTNEKKIVVKFSDNF